MDWKELLKILGPVLVEILRIIFKAPVAAARNVTTVAVNNVRAKRAAAEV